MGGVTNKRVWLLLSIVFLIPVVPWLMFGAPLEGWIERAVADHTLSPTGRWLAAGAGVGLLAVDSFLPIPSTLMMSALGLGFGLFWGGLLATTGLLCSGLVAYGCCRRWGVRVAERIAGERGLQRVRESMARMGPLAIAVTRSVPVVQEATACLAGLAEMRFRVFFLALLAGCVPTGFAYAAIGASALRSQSWGLTLSVLVPAFTWPLVFLLLRRFSQPGT